MLAIVGGSGRLPDILTEAVPDARRYAPRGVTFGCDVHSAAVFRFEQLGALVEEFRSAGIRSLAFAGAVRRPALDMGALDTFTQEALAQIGPTFAQGDDAVLRGIVEVFEREGFEVVAAHDLVPDLLPPVGVITKAGPRSGDGSDAARGFAVLEALGRLDVGQACVVAAGQVLAIETLGGTDWMLGTLAGEVPGRPAAPCGVLCKAPKDGQERRVDLPAIGPATVAAAVAARLNGIAIEAGGVLLLDPSEVAAAADEAGLFVWVRPR